MTKTAKFWEMVRTAYEAGEVQTEIAEKFDVSVGSIQGHAKKDGWVKADGTVSGADAVLSELNDELAARVAELEAQVADVEAEAERLSPSVKLKLPTTAQEVLDSHGDDVFRELTLLKIAGENMARFQKGLPPLDFTNNPEIVDAKMLEYAEKVAAQRKKPPSEIYRQRVVKVKKLNGNLVQIPVEEQISNEAGQAGAAIWKAREKGDKVLDPYLCQMRDCWLEAATDTVGQLSLNGYCSVEHRSFDPYLNQNDVANVATSRSAAF
jgi:hypothetical protein